jgi:hypothetical protein
MSRGVRLSIGIIMIVLGALSLFGALGLLVVFGFDNTATSPTFRITGEGRAVVWGTGLIRQATPIPSRFSNSISLQVEGGDREVFVGIGPTQEVARYLAGTSVDRVTSVGWPGRVLVTQAHSGGAVPGPPDAPGNVFWAAKASGPGTQGIDWTIRPGAWTVVVMNADASAGIDVQAQGSLRIGSIGLAMGVLATVGLGLVGGGIAVLVSGRGRGRRGSTSGTASPLAVQAKPATPWEPRPDPNRPGLGSSPPPDQGSSPPP